MVEDDLGGEIIVVIWVFTAVAIVTVALKLFTRQKFLQGLGWDDFFIFLSLVLIVVCTAIFTYDVQLGMGMHTADLGFDRTSAVIRINLIANPFGIMAYSFPNISVAILLERLLAPNKLRTQLLHLLAILQVVVAGVSCILLFVQCTPTDYVWNPTIEGAKCFPAGTVVNYSYFVGSFTALTDIILGIVPIAAFWKLKLPLRSKIGLCVLMGCTLFAAVCSIVKTTKLDSLSDFLDFTYSSAELIIWAIVEANVIIIAACLPTLRPFFHNTFNKDKVPASEGRGFLNSLFGGGTAGSASKRSVVTPNCRSGVLAPSNNHQQQPPPPPPAPSRPVRQGSTDSQREIWRTTDIRQHTSPYEARGEAHSQAV